MTSPVRIRTAHAGEAELLLEIQRASAVAGFAHVFPPDEYPFPGEAVLERWQRALADPDEDVVVAELDARAVGLSAVRPEWLDALYVIPPFWGTGVGGRPITRLRGCANSAVSALTFGCWKRTRVRAASTRTAAGA